MKVSTEQHQISPSFSDVAKRVFLGKPLTTELLSSETLSNPVALGALSPDAISSSSYGAEQTLLELLPHAGLASFALLLPITGVIQYAGQRRNISGIDLTADADNGGVVVPANGEPQRGVACIGAGWKPCRTHGRIGNSHRTTQVLAGARRGVGRNGRDAVRG